LRAHPCIKSVTLLVIKADDLLAMGDNSGFAGCDYPTVRHHSLYVGSERSQLVSEALPGLVFPDNPTCNDVSTKGTNVGDDIPCTSSMQTFMSNMNDWYRRFRRNTLNLSPNVTIEHQVTNNQHANLGKLP